MGSVVIYQTLYDLFPPTSIDPDCVSPLTASEFLQRILVPEVGARLLIQDMYMDETEMDDAVKILRESANYGVAMFPADDGEEGEGRDDGELGAADMILMKRAMKRRKELDEDEKEEEEEFQREIREKEKREKEREKEIESSPPRPPPRRKPRHIGKITSTASIINDVEMVPSVPLEGDTDIDDAPRSAHDPPRPRPLPSRGRPGTLEQLAGNPESKKASDTRPKPRRLPSANIPRSTDTDVEDAPLHSSQSRPKPRRLVSQSSIDVRPPDANATPRKAKHSIPAQDSSDVDIDLCSSSEDAADNDDDDDWDVGRMERGKKKRKAKAKAKGTSKALNTTSINAARIDNDFPLPSSTRTPRKSVSREKRFLDSDEEETPRPGRVKSSAQALPYEPPNDLVPPLQRARERKARSTALSSYSIDNFSDQVALFE
ncbi:hypothetical protein C0991_004809 [Blastosporella zonata]|nr:hypothetical protein C0991_004809 [Blastosporella zonata]